MIVDAERKSGEKKEEKESQIGTRRDGRKLDCSDSPSVVVSVQEEGTLPIDVLELGSDLLLPLDATKRKTRPKIDQFRVRRVEKEKENSRGRVRRLKGKEEIVWSVFGTRSVDRGRKAHRK